MSAELREKAANYYRALWSGDPADAMGLYLAGDYVEHQYGTGFTAQGMRDYVLGRRAEHREHAVVVHHILGDGNFVFLLAEEKLGGNVDYARAELFRFDGSGRIAEHWGSHVLDDKNRKNANGTFDGSKVNRSVDHARRFGEQFEEYDRRAFNAQELEIFEISRVPGYRQHSPKGGDGLTGLVEILSKAKDAGIKVSMTRYRTLTDGDFLVSHRLYDTEPTHPLMNRIYTFDMFRLDSQGRAVEHWDVMDPVPSAELLERMA